MKEVYIYCLKDSQNNIRYIGKTNNVEKRLQSHISEAKRYNKSRHVLNWIKSLINNGELPTIEIIETVSQDKWEEREKYWISHFRETIPNLCNNCDGGLGGVGRNNFTQEEIENKRIIMSNTFSKFNIEDKEIIWKMIKDNKTQLEIMEKYSEYTRSIDFGVRNGRQWKSVTGLNYINNNLKRKGYTCRNGLYMIRRKINGIYKVVFSSRNEKEIITWLEDEQHIGNGRLNM